MKKHKLSLGAALPDEAAACDACIERLLKALGGRRGISGAHVDRAAVAAPRLCLHYDATAVGVEDIQKLVASAGAELKAKYEHLSAPLSGLRHEGQARLVEGVFAKQPGVLHVVVSFGSRRLYVEFDPTVTSRSALLAVTSRADVSTWEESATPAEAEHKHDEHAHEHGGPFGERSELVFSLACGAVTGIGWGLIKTPAPPLVPTMLFIVAYGLVALMADDLGALPFAVGLSRAARRIGGLFTATLLTLFVLPAIYPWLAGAARRNQA